MNPKKVLRMRDDLSVFLQEFHPLTNLESHEADEFAELLIRNGWVNEYPKNWKELN